MRDYKNKKDETHADKENESSKVYIYLYIKHVYLL